MNILLTGATGFIGSFVAEKLLKEGHSVFCTKRPASSLWRLDNIKERIFFITLDSLSDIPKIFFKRQIEMIVHLAGAYIKNEYCMHDIQLLHKANVLFPSLLFQAGLNNGVKYIINTGTCFEYARLNRKLKESDKLLPYNYYAATKIMAENILRYYAGKNQLNAVTLRLFYAYGEKDNDKIITLLVKSSLSRKPMHIGNAISQLNFTYVEDIASAFILAIQYMQTSKTVYQVFNIGSDKTYSLKEIIRILQKISGGSMSHVKLEAYPYDGIKYMNCNNQKAEKILSWNPQFTLPTAVERMYKYYQQHQSK